MVSFGLGEKKERCFFGLVTSVGQRKNFFNLILFCNCVFLFVCLLIFICSCLLLSASVHICFFLSFFLCSSYNKKTQTSL